MRVAVLCTYRKSSLVVPITQAFVAQGADVHLWAVDEVIPEVEPWTRGTGILPKLDIFNALLARVDGADFTLFTDDDIGFPPDFLPRFLDAAARWDADLLQPALSLGSYHTLVQTLVRPQLLARRVNWVEQMVFGMSRRMVAKAMPAPSWLGQASWGVEHHWDDVLRANGWRAYVVDSLPVDHVFRPVGAAYNQWRAHGYMLSTFAKHAPTMRLASMKVEEEVGLDGVHRPPTLTLTAEAARFLEAVRPLPLARSHRLYLCEKAHQHALDESAADFEASLPAAYRGYARVGLYLLQRAQEAGVAVAAEVKREWLAMRSAPPERRIETLVNARLGFEDWHLSLRGEPTLLHGLGPTAPESPAVPREA